MVWSSSSLTVHIANLNQGTILESVGKKNKENARPIGIHGTLRCITAGKYATRTAIHNITGRVK